MIWWTNHDHELEHEIRFTLGHNAGVMLDVFRFCNPQSDGDTILGEEPSWCHCHIVHYIFIQFLLTDIFYFVMQFPNKCNENKKRENFEHCMYYVFTQIVQSTIKSSQSFLNILWYWYIWCKMMNKIEAWMNDLIMKTESLVKTN